jgi:hypothetical protein
VREGRQAQELLSSEAFSESVARARGLCFDMWEKSPAVEAREHAHSILMAMNLIVRMLVTAADAAEMAAAELKRREKA